jgi:Rho-binding antiterminator
MPSTIPYMPVPGFYRERFTIAIMCNEWMELHWRDESSGMSYLTKVCPLELFTENGMDYVRARTMENGEVKIRLDLIQNMPRPVK